MECKNQLVLVVMLMESLLLSPVSTKACGKAVSPHRTGRIVGGIPAKDGQFPWQVMLARNRRVICGGAVVSPNFVLTAAHCIADMNPRTFHIVTGAIRKADVGKLPHVQVRKVKKFIVHPDWKTDIMSLKHDIALINVNSSFIFDGSTAPACLPASEDWGQQKANILTISGFGTTTEQGEPSPQLLYTQVPVMPDTDCTSIYPQLFDNSTMFCAKTLEGGHDSCQGDSGGPAVAEALDLFHVTGIVSWGLGCGRRKYPGVYTKVAMYLPWITASIMHFGETGDREVLEEQFTSSQMARFRAYARQLFGNQFDNGAKKESSWLSAVLGSVFANVG